MAKLRGHWSVTNEVESKYDFTSGSLACLFDGKSCFNSAHVK